MQSGNATGQGWSPQVDSSYLKTQGAPTATMEAHEGLTIYQHKSWKAAVDPIQKLLG